MATALYPGAYKPPHKGHFEVVERLLSGAHKGKVYNIGNYKEVGAQTLGEDNIKVEPINKVVIFIGGKDRNGISPEQSKAVWNIYAQYLKNVEVIIGDRNPMVAAKDYAKANPNENFYAVTGIRSEEDLGDLRRITTFKNRPNVEGLMISGDESNTRATDFRKSLLSGNLDTVLDFFPSMLKREEILKIVNMLKQSIISEKMGTEVEDLFKSWFDKDLKESSSGTPISPQTILRSVDRAKLVRVYNQLKNVLGDTYYKITFQQDHVRISLKEEGERAGFDYTPYMASILEYMIDEGMKITPLPEVKVKRDIAEAADFFGKTAFYDPNENTIMLYTENRHPKDVMRSFTHEMIHHIQNLEGRLTNVDTSNTNEDSNLLEIEKEAYLRGNITFRNWEDKVKN
tara:strand:+ start:5499 stop:6698 length:1200 start_codon:yes stop_codon:yes gene_type:complete